MTAHLRRGGRPLHIRWRLSATAPGLMLAFGLALGAGMTVRVPPATPAVLHRKIDFEATAYGSPGRRLSDFCFLAVAGTWHLFYTDLVSENVPLCRIGHATSSDLIHWTERPTVVTEGGSGWIATGTWAPHVVARPGGGWILFYTGRNPVGAQAILGMVSSDLDTWTPASAAPLWIPTTAAWAAWDSTETSSCRDPFVWFEGGFHRMIYTATTNNGRPAIGKARSADLLAWSDDGPFAIDSTSGAPVDLESPHLVFDNGRVELLYSRYWTRILTAPTSAGPWDVGGGTTIDAQGIAPEKLKSGTAQMISRLRFDVCDDPTAIIVIDTVTATVDGYDVPDSPGIPFAWRQDGDAFASGTTYGDGPLRRGAVPASPHGLRWVGSGENYRNPSDPLEACDAPSRDSQLGWLRSPRFTLLGDSLWFRVMGAASPDSAYVRLLDACTGLELARRTGPNGTALVPAAWSNAGRRGWPVEIELVDLLTRPGGVIGADTFVDSTVGTFTAPSPVAINQTLPAGGENLTPGTTYTIRWTSFHPAGMDSHLVYVSYDNFATPPIRLQKRNGNQFSWGWLVPAGPLFDVRIRVVAYAKNGVHDCDTSGPFSIAVTAGVPDDPAGGGGTLALAARGSPGPTPVLEWSAPAGTRAWLHLYDVRGRHVRTLVAGEAADPDGAVRRVSWDGRDAAGRAVPPGLYFARLADDAGTSRGTRLVRLDP